MSAENNPLQEAVRRIEEVNRSDAAFLDLSELNLTAVPDTLCRLANLQQLTLGNNQITTIPRSLSQLTKLQRLFLNNNQITAIPDSFAHLTNLQMLSLGNNQITAIPDCLAQLADLQSLLLHNNQITAIPDSLAHLTDLQRLFLNNNQITAVPDSLAKLANLQELFLNNNQITAIPDSLAKLAKLQRLYLNNNQIAAIPDSLARLAKLQELYLGNNRITVIPDSLAQLVSLQTLSLDDNHVTTIPDSLARLTNLRILDLVDNPLPDEVFAALKRGVPSLFRYLESIRKTCPRTVKLVLLGEPKSGKTTLLQALGNSHPCDDTRLETLGVNVLTIEQRHPIDGQPMYLSVWDFAGQHIEHATHQFFLTENAIYLILWNARQGTESGKRDLWYWLELLKMRVRDPKFLLVATHTEHTPPDLNLSEIERSYKGNQGHFSIELSNLKGFAALQTIILNLAADDQSDEFRNPFRVQNDQT